MRALTLFALFTGSALAADSVTLINSKPLTARSTFELRFSEAMVAPEIVGKTTDSPLVIRPALAGKFVWVSERSGVFTPTEVPPLNTTFQFTLPPELKTAADAPFVATLDETQSTPGFEIKARLPQYSSGNDAPAVPKCALLFNVPVDATQINQWVYFTNKAGERVPARVVPQDAEGRQELSRYASSDRSLLTWDEQFRVRTGEEETRALTGPRPNAVYLVPAQPLPPGLNWQLVADAGLPGANGMKLFRPEHVNLGTVRPFEVAQVKAENTLGSGRRIVVNFSKALAEEVKPENYRRWFTVTPAPENLKAEAAWNSSIVFTGDFKLNTDYTLTAAAGLPAKEPFVLSSEYRATVMFQQVAPVVALETYNTHQLASGSRKVRINTVNVPRVRVIAKVFQPDTVAGAQSAYEKYFSWQNDESRQTRVEMEKLPGRVSFDREFALKAETDQDETLALNSDDIVGVGQTGVAIITVEATDNVSDGNKRPGAQAMIQLTDLGLVWKDSPTETFGYVFSLATGAPVEGAKLQWIAKDGNVLTEVTTKADGTARLPKNEKAAWLLATYGKDIHLVDSEARDHFDRGRFHVSWDGVSENDEAIYDGQEGNQRRVFLFTDRPVYKPGETTHFKAIVRDERPGIAPLAVGEEATLEVRDARNRLFLSQKIKLSEVGSLAADIALPPSPLGAYTAKLRFAGDSEDVEHSMIFRMEEYVPNAFEITVQPPHAPVGEQKLEIAMQAKYYMGKPLSKAKVAWSIKAEDSDFAPEGWENFTFCNAIDSYRVKEARGQSSEFNDQGELALDEKGGAKFASTVPLNPRAPQPRGVNVRCEVTDVNQQTISESSSFTLHSSEYYLGVGEFPDVLREGDNLPVRLAAVRADGTCIADGAPAQLRLLRVDWQTNRGVGADRSDSYRSTPSFILVGSVATRTTAVEKRKEQWVFPERQAPAAEFPLSKPGEYLLEATAKDASGHDVVTTRSVYVYGQGATVWNYRNKFQIELTPDKEEYFAGDQATILVKTPIAGDALVTVERENVRRSYVVKLAGNAPSVTVPIEAGDAPNVYISVLVLRGAADSTYKAKMPEYRVGYAALTVKRRDAELTVYAKPSKESYEPGQEVELQVEARDAEGHAAVGAEITLYAVDEGVLSLMGYETPDPFSYFNERRALAVDTGLTLPELMPEDEEELEFGNKGYLVGGGGDEDSAELRNNFIACAYWNAALKTGADGKVSAKFKAPDSLTRYRVIAVAQTARDQFGSGESAFEINKPVMIEAAPPRFGNVGDQMMARAVVHNTTDQPGEAVIALTLDATATSAEPLTRTVPLPAKATLAVDFPVEFKEPGEAVWKWSVKFTAQDGGAKHADAMESRMKVGYPAPMLRQVLQARAKPGETNLLAGIDPALLDGSGVVQVRLSNSRLLDLREGLNQLLHYPYGCVEQTTSSTLPWLSLRELGPALPELMRTDAEVTDAIRYGVNRLFTMQTPSGGLAYWPGGTEPLLYASAWGGFGIAWARKSGVAVPEEDFAKLMKYLSQTLRGTGAPSDAGDKSSQCLALFTLAVGGQPEPAYHELFFKNRAQLDAQERAWLALAIMEAKGPREMVKTLLEETKLPQTDRSNWYCAARTPATQLMAWCRYDGKAPAVDKLVAELMNARRQGHWYTTQGNAWAVLSLGDYVQKVESGRRAETGAITANGERFEFELGEKAICWTKEFPLRPGMTPRLVLTHTGKSALFTDVSVEVRPKNIPLARADRGYIITRKYQRVEDDGKLTAPRDLKVGDRILVSLEVEVPNRAEYLAIEDPLPANFEAINPNFTSQAAEGAERAGTPWQCDFSELRTDRALFFVNETGQGRFYISYLARVRAAGTATAPAAKVEEMYEPDHFATTVTGKVTTAKWD